MKRLLNLVIAAGNGLPEQLECPKDKHSLEVITTGTFTALTVILQGSITGLQWATLATAVFAAGDFTNEGKMVFGEGMAERVRAKVSTYSSGCAAMGTLTIGGALASGNTVTIDVTIYKFGTTLATAEGSILIDASPATSIINLGLAITHGTGEGVKYTSAAEHPSATSGTIDATTVIVRAKAIGAIGNAIATSATGATLTFGHTSLRLGKDPGVVSAYYTPYPNL